MIGASAIGSESLGGFTNNYEFAEIAIGQWNGGVSTVTLFSGTPAVGQWNAVDALSKYVYEALSSGVSYWGDAWLVYDGTWDDDRRWIDEKTWNDDPNITFVELTLTIDSAVGDFVGGNPITSIVGESSDGASWKGGQSTIVLVVDPATGDWIAGDGTATASGTVTVTANAGAVGEWVGGNATPQYVVSVEGIPDLIVNRSGSDVTIKVRNLNGKEATIEKATTLKGQYSTLTTMTSSPYSESGVSGEPKYRAYFSFTGSIGGNSVTYEGSTSTSRLTKE